MAYATQQDLVDRFGAKELIELTDRTNKPVTTIDATVVAEGLADAAGLIDSYIGKQYNLPLGTVPPILTKICADIARKYLHGDRAGKDHPVTRAYEDALAWLKDVARGLVELEDGAGNVPAPSGGGQVRLDAPERIMSRDSLKGYS